MGDLLYACVQLVHNVGAAAVVGSPAVAWWLSSSQFAEALSNRRSAIMPVQRRLAWLTLLAWSIQIASGAGFGATTYYLKHELPDLTGIGLGALCIKVFCALASAALATIYLRAASNWPDHVRLRVWQTLFVLGLTALMSAAFLRWYA